MQPNEPERLDESPQPEILQEAPDVSSPPVMDQYDDQPTQLPTIEPVQWQAVEYVQQAKQPIWYVGFAVIVIGLMIVAVFVMQAWSFAVLLLVMAAALMVYVHRPARELSYVLSEKGLYINDQLHPLGEFKSFGVLEDEGRHSLFLVPVKRFRPGLSIFFPTEFGERIVDLLGAYLPMQDVKLDAFDKIVRKLRL